MGEVKAKQSRRLEFQSGIAIDNDVCWDRPGPSCLFASGRVGKLVLVSGAKLPCPRVFDTVSGGADPAPIEARSPAAGGACDAPRPPPARRPVRPRPPT